MRVSSRGQAEPLRSVTAPLPATSSPVDDDDVDPSMTENPEDQMTRQAQPAPLHIDPPEPDLTGDEWKTELDYQERGGRPDWIRSVLEPNLNDPRHRDNTRNPLWASQLRLAALLVIVFLFGLVVGAAF